MSGIPTRAATNCARPQWSDGNKNSVPFSGVTRHSVLTSRLPSDTMSQPNDAPLFSVSNHHPGGTNESPSIDGDNPNAYHSYFENMHGEQSLFVYRRDTKEAVLYCGDAGWQAFPVRDGIAQGLILSPDEETWLLACLKAIGLNTAHHRSL